MADDNRDIKLEFIRQELSKHGQWLQQVFLSVITKQQHIVSSQLINSIRFDVQRSELGYSLNFSFLDYGRFFDIAAYEGHKKKRNDFNDNLNKLLWGINTNRKKKARIENPFYNPDGGGFGLDGKRNAKYIYKVNKWYARTMYGGIGKLCAAVMYGLTDTEIERIKNELQNKQQNNG